MMAKRKPRASKQSATSEPVRDGRVRFHMIGHAHLDPVWLWRWYEGFAEAKATFRSALDRMKEFPDFIFTASAAAHYEWIEKSDPAMFAEIKRRVKKGRWVPAGGWWVESDLNLVHGECLVRQALLGKRYFREKLGFECRVGFSPDSFGHSAHLPKILRGCGFEGYLYMRPSDAENPRVPMPVYRWIAPDGSEVIAFRIVWSYNGHSVAALENKHEKLPQIIKDSAFADEMFFFYGVGNHGGGPTIELLKTIKAWQKDPKRHEVMFSSIVGPPPWLPTP
jgi:alpha-mannosidase